MGCPHFGGCYQKPSPIGTVVDMVSIVQPTSSRVKLIGSSGSGTILPSIARAVVVVIGTNIRHNGHGEQCRVAMPLPPLFDHSSIVCSKFRHGTLN